MSERNVIVQQLITVDGYVADESGGLEFFDVVSDYSEVDAENLSILRDVDTILLGGRTYDLFVQYWPDADEPVAETVNTIPKVVYSGTRGEAPWGRWDPAKVHGADAADHVRRLRQEPGQNIMVWGSISVTQALFDADLVDELQLRMVPVVLGAGRKLIDTETRRRGLTLLEARPYSSGIVSLRYAAGSDH